jgi:Spy/CpxP family protein refolding chaperone
MQRSKQQALMFLLGAVLVGGVLGAASDRVWRHQQMVDQLSSRHAFYERIGLSSTQQVTLDSLLNQQDCAIRGVLAPQKPALDSIRASFHSQIQQVFTPEQQARLDAETKARHDRDAREGKEQKRQCSK